jgi:magnesium chelatase family protein
VGVAAPEVRVEVHLSGGLPSTQIVGLPEAAVRESRERVRAALLCAQFEFPQRRITINLAPADLPKDGGRFDLPIALGILAASGQIDRDALRNFEFVGELALTGEVRAVDGVLPAVLAAARAGRQLVAPAGNSAEAALAGDAQAVIARTLLQVCEALRGRAPWPRAELDVRDVPIESPCAAPDLADVRGQPEARRALEVAAAGGHHLLLCGSPGSGKTLLASRLSGLLPQMTQAEALEVAAVGSASGRRLDPAQWRQRPFRSPHHTASAIALVGGGSHPRPGEISLAHQGVLFLDELPEWGRHALEVLREPLESGIVTVARAGVQADFPARFQLVAAMNPCPCGWAGDSSGRCRCGAEAVRRYRSRISGPLLERIDLHVEVPRLPARAMRTDGPKGENSQTVRARVLLARERQWARAGCLNAHLDQVGTERDCTLRETDAGLLERAIEQWQLSARSLHRILRVARTIADLAQSPTIETAHVAEAIGYRRLDRDMD